MEATKVYEFYFRDFLASKCLPRTFLSQNHGFSTYITLGQSKIWRQWCQPNVPRKSIGGATCWQMVHVYCHCKCRLEVKYKIIIYVFPYRQYMHQ